MCMQYFTSCKTIKPSNLKNILLLHAQPKKEKRKRTKAIKGYEKRNREMNNLW
jgi:hypothetical protein